MILRSLFFIFIFVPVMIVGIPIQWVITRLGLYWNFLPFVFHTLGRIFLGMKVKVIGTPSTGKPTLIVSNHISWTDIIAIGSQADVTFVAKSEIRNWFFVGFMGSLQRTLYVDRKRRSDAARASKEMGQRMASGGAVVLFAEGQSDLGTHVLPFRSALIGAAQHAMLEAGAGEVMIQPLTIAYTRLQGLPVGRTDRSFIAWIKSKSIKQNIVEILTGGTREVTLAFGTPRPLGAGANRKTVAKDAENEVRRMLVALNRGTPLPEAAAPAS
ncbi:lysophospholipid acyltransferase family protein [Devosia sp.]|uniref:lysophospholipid acyltransferase family protein n=1 Tax=Devosia sp. TaxID=1871048 RepID=UPI003A929581